ncbi:uncharacterized protein V6R79_023595 [Siganus canaliculatus]
MAGSRLEKFGTVYTRVRDLMRSGVMKPSEKPLWYDVYRAFPPKREPLSAKTNSSPWAKKEDTVPEILYSEDKVRARFYEHYGTGPRPFDVSKSNFVSTCQRFVDKYSELAQGHSELDESSLFEETGKALLAEGIVLKRRGAPVGSSESRDSVLELKLTDMLEEQQSSNAESKETVDPTTHTTDPSSPTAV